MIQKLHICQVCFYRLMKLKYCFPNEVFLPSCLYLNYLNSGLMFISFFFFCKMLEDSSRYLHSLVELVKETFQFSLWYAIYRMFEFFFFNNLIQIWNYICVLWLFSAMIKTLFMTFGPSPPYPEPI